MAFDRVAELFVGVFKDEANPRTGYQVEGLHFDFDIIRSAEFFKDQATFSVYNANQQTIQEIMDSGTSVIFRAGYRDQEVGNIFIGQIAKAYPETTPGGDTIIHMICNAQRGAQFRLCRTFVSLNFSVGTSYYTILKTVADYVGVPLSGASSLREVSLTDDDGPYVDTGTVRDVVTNFTTRFLREIGGKIILSNNEMLYVNTADRTTFETAYLTFKSGLLGAKSVRDEKFQSSEDAFQANQEYYLGMVGRGKNDGKEPKVDTPNEVQFESLIHPGVNINAPVYIDARRNADDHISVVGRFYPTQIRYTGSNYGSDFKMTVTAVEK